MVQTYAHKYGHVVGVCFWFLVPICIWLDGQMWHTEGKAEMFTDALDCIEMYICTVQLGRK